MNALERVMATIKGEPVDRPPVMAVLAAYGGTLTGVPLPILYQDADAYIAGQMAVFEGLGFDAVIGSFDYSAIAEAFGGTPVFFTHQAPNMKRPAARTLEDALALPLPDPQRTGRLPLALDCVRGLAGRLNSEAPVIGVLPGPAALPVLLLGMETWMEGILFSRENADALLERTGIFWVQWARALLEAGATFVVATEGMAPREVTTRDLFESLLPHIRSCFEQVEGPIVFHHTGGSIGHVLDLLRDLPQLAGVTIGSKDCIEGAREALGPGLPILGNLDNLTLASGNASEVRALTESLLDLAAAKGPMLICNSGADIPTSTPRENLEAMRNAAWARTTPQPTPGSEATPKQLPKTPPKKPRCLACGVLRAELDELTSRGELPAEVHFFNSRLHMHPLDLDRAVDGATCNADQETLLIYGDCCPSMLQFQERQGISRLPVLNCCQMLLGAARYRELMREGAFLLLPEWAPRWRDILREELGFSSPEARDFMQDQVNKLVYVDTGLQPIPKEELDACAASLGLPWEVEPTGLDHLRNLLTEALSKMKAPRQDKM
jgi:uroporphyrinogen decarboxylase